MPQSEKQREYNLAYYLAHREHIKAASRAYQASNADSIKLKKRLYYEEHREQNIAHHKAWYEKNKEHARECGRIRGLARTAARRALREASKGLCKTCGASTVGSRLAHSSYVCDMCHSAKRRAQRAACAKQIREYMQKYRAEHKTEIAIQSSEHRRKTYAETLEESRAKGRAYYLANPQPTRARSKIRYRELVQHNPKRILLDSAKVRSRRRGIPFNLSLADIRIPNTCPILGIRIVRGVGKLSAHSPSIDRIIPELGYVAGNIAIISNRANTIKSNGTAEEHERIAAWMKSWKQNASGAIESTANTSSKLWEYARDRAKAKKVEFSIAKADVIIPDRCPVFGMPLVSSVGSKATDVSPSIDRFDSNLGYIVGNVSVISRRANTLKNSGSAEEHQRIADWIRSMVTKEQKAA